MSAFIPTTAATTTSTLAGLGFTFDSTPTKAGSFSSSEESFDSFSSETTLVSSHELVTGDSPSASPVESASKHSSEDVDGKHSEPYLGVLEVADFVPWPTSLSVGADARTSTRSEEEHATGTPNDGGYEGDTEGTRAVRHRRRRRNADKLSGRPVRYVVDHVESVFDEAPFVAGYQEHVESCASPEPEQVDAEGPTTNEPTATHGTTISCGIEVRDVDETPRVFYPEYEFDSDANVDYDSDLDSDAEVIDLTNYIGGGYSDSDEWSLPSDAEYHSDSDSDVDHYYGDENGLPCFFAPAERRPVHYVSQRVRPNIEEVPTLEEIYARMRTEGEDMSDEPLLRLAPRRPEGYVDPEPEPVAEDEGTTIITAALASHTVGLGITFPSHDDEFETIDLSDDAPTITTTISAPTSPALRPHAPEGFSPSPIILAAPVPVAAFRRFDDVLRWAEDGVHAAVEVAVASPIPVRYAEAFPLVSGFEGVEMS
ncbi:hypothetical protein C8Q79DRAFT_483666 [Trametes meyenii]|nr:hypothetical protein C8Q79DRAFT_483666 [Trametes meyenii]